MASDPFYNAKADTDVSDWMDGAGACKICQGEIPDGHSLNCVIYKMQTQIRGLKEALRKAPPPIDDNADGISNYAARTIYREWYRKERKKALKNGT